MVDMQMPEDNPYDNFKGNFCRAVCQGLATTRLLRIRYDIDDGVEGFAVK